MQSIRSATVASALRGACRQSSHTAFSSLQRSLCAKHVRGLATTQSQDRNILTSRNGFITAVSPASRQQTRNASSSSDELQKTPLYDLNIAHGGKMVPFGGYLMPVQYSGLTVSQSHTFTREHCSIFDVSHMVQRFFTGDSAANFLQRITPSDIAGLGRHRSTLSVFLHADESGGIVDDTIITRLTDTEFYVVTNAACREKDDKYLEAELEKWNSDKSNGFVKQTQANGYGLVALQGPEAESILTEALASPGDGLKNLYFGQSVYQELRLPNGKPSTPLLISRGGYTGEDGFEISIPGPDVIPIMETLLASGPEKVQLAGLGARDSLRLEAGMCLYGHDLDDSTTPVEAALSWIIPKERRSADAGYYGADIIAKQLVPKSKGGSGVLRRRVGLLVEGAPAREGAEIVSRDGGAKLGAVTSGCPSPTLGKNIAMGYIQEGFHKSGTEVDVLVRGRPRKAVVTKMPFVPTKYWKGIAPA
ncbi:hypothetical protein B0H63DRAFT_387953 [Podospora didyma]|uniref:Aminomethyltransferase n=1 Tax=Podospora didyma TaxID=330526 RepID=A0AAE0U8D3_9PEZI|nr:hypothetical protein B0H63DRAFT_387953 [Podospora didyma]